MTDQHLMLLHVACRVVEAEPTGSIRAEDACCSENEARPVSLLHASSSCSNASQNTASISSSSLIAADLMIGLKKHSQPARVTSRPQLSPSRRGERSLRPRLLPSVEGLDKSTHGAFPSSLTSFLGKRAKPGDDSAKIENASPTSVWEAETSPSVRVSISSAGAPSTTAAQAQIAPQPLPMVWSPPIPLSQAELRGNKDQKCAKRRVNVSSNPPKASSPATYPSSRSLKSSCSAARPPLLVRRVSAEWRHDVKDTDRAKTRERIDRALRNHCDGEMEKALFILSALEEELLHVKSTTKPQYFDKAVELCTRIETLRGTRRA